MTLRRRRPPRHHHPVGVRRLARAFAVTALVAAPFLAAPIGAAPAGAQEPPAEAPAPTVDAAGTAIGLVEIDDDLAIGWVAADGVVVTSDRVATDVGASATFVRRDTRTRVECYVAVRHPDLALALLRCADLEGDRLPLVSAYPTPGTAATVTYLSTRSSRTAPVAAVTPTFVVSNDIRFMGSTRPQYAVAVGAVGAPIAPGTIPPGALNGAPIVGADGKVLGTVLTAPRAGGNPLGTTPRELERVIDDVSDVPSSFAAAAVLSVGRRAIIPVIAGLVLGLAWALLSRSGNALFKTLGLAMLGLFVAAGYSLLVAVAVGPETLVI